MGLNRPNLAMDNAMYSEELAVAVRVVHMACCLCQRVQDGLVGTSSEQVKSKDDDSPVTVAGIFLFPLFSIPILLNWVLFFCGLGFEFCVCDWACFGSGFGFWVLGDLHLEYAV